MNESFSRGFLIGTLMLLLFTSSCDLPAGTPIVPVGTILPTEQGTTAVLPPTNTSINDTPTASIPITGATLPANTSTPPPTQILPQVPTQVSTQTSISPPATASTSVLHAQPTKATLAPVSTQQSGIGIQDPEQFVRWYFGAVWQIRDYENLWNNYLTPGFKTVVSPGGYTEYVTWWNSVQRVDINSINVLQNDGTRAVIRVNVTFSMKDGRIIDNQEYDYDLLYDANRQTWMFDVHT